MSSPTLTGAAWWDDLDALGRIEGALLPRPDLEALRAILAATGVEPDAWLEIPALRQVFTHRAVRNLVTDLIAQGHTREQAERLAPLQLGVPPETARTWLRRWRERGGV